MNTIHKIKIGSLMLGIMIIVGITYHACKDDNEQFDQALERRKLDKLDKSLSDALKALADKVKKQQAQSEVAKKIDEAEKKYGEEGTDEYERAQQAAKMLEEAEAMMKKAGGEGDKKQDDDLSELERIRGIFKHLVVIPDKHFLKYLKRLVPKAFPNEGNLLYTQSTALRGVILMDINGERKKSNEHKITSLKGIEYFTALQFITLADIKIDSLSLSQFPVLVQVKLMDNKNYIKSVSLSELPRLEKCYIQSNDSIGSVSLSQLPALDEFALSRNTINRVSLSQFYALTDISFSSLSVWQYNKIKSLSLDNLPALKIFRPYEDNDKSVILNHLPALETLILEKMGMDSLSLDNFPALETFNCRHNQLTSLNVSQLTKSLKTLNCGGNPFTTLDVSSLTALEELNCSDNQLTSLNTSQLPKSLKKLDCGGNPFTTLDVSSLTALEELNCVGDDNHYLTSLSSSQLPKSLKKLNCGWNQLTTLDVSSLTALEELNCKDNQLNFLDVSHKKKLTSLRFLGNGTITVKICGTPIDKKGYSIDCMGRASQSTGCDKVTIIKKCK